MEKNKDIYKSSRILLIIEAALEYFISLVVTGAYLAKVTSAIGMSDTLTGILTSFVSLGFGFQVVAIFFSNKRSVKPFVTVLCCLNQLFFALIYFVPFISVSKTQKTILFIVFLLLGYILSNVVYAPKINWYTTLVDDDKRGRLTANKEIVSLIGGMLFSLAMSKVIDTFEANGDVNGAFLVCGFSILVLMLLHTASLIFAKEKPTEGNQEKTSVARVLVELVKDKKLIKVILLSVIWNVAHYVSTPFYGSYQIKELGFSMTFVSVLSVAYAVVRALFSNPLGKYADKHSFAKMLNICFVIMLVAFAINVFTVPQNGKILYTLHYVLYAVGMAGINSATINLIFDYVEKEKRTAALAINGTLSGFAGFFTTLLVSPLVSYIQSNGNRFLGISIYAQQVVSLISVILLIVVLAYLNVVIKKIKKTN